MALIWRGDLSEWKTRSLEESVGNKESLDSSGRSLIRGFLLFLWPGRDVLMLNDKPHTLVCLVVSESCLMSYRSFKGLGPDK